MTRYFTWRTLVLAILLVSSSIASCVDTEPVVVPDSPPSELSQDASVNDCQKCTEAADSPGPGCAMERAGCYKFTACRQTAECGVANGCFNAGSVSDFTSCLISCGETYHLAEDADSTTASYPYYNCIVGTCAPTCFGDAGP
jgi:hypothetical protein